MLILKAVRTQRHQNPSVSVSPSVACPIPYAEKIPGKNWLSLIDVILISSFHRRAEKSILPIEARETRKGISIEYWFIKATSLLHK